MTITDPTPYADPLMHGLTLTSTVNDSEYELRIGLPYSYHALPDRAYPLFIVLDGEGFALAVAEQTRGEAVALPGPLGGGTGPIPEFITVAVCLPGTNPVRRNFEYMPRTERHEFVPSAQAFIGQIETMLDVTVDTGGVDAFLKVLEDEIIPGVARHFRVSHDVRMIFGHSASACFAAYVLLTRPDLFTDYIIASPGFVPEIFRREEAWAAGHDDLKARVLLTAGERELHDPLAIVSDTMRLAELLNGRSYPGLKLRSWLVPDALHHQTALPSVVRALSGMGGL